MNMFLAISIAVSAQWPGLWVESEIRPAAERIVAESISGGEWQVKEIGAWTCVVDVTDSNLAPECARDATHETSRGEDMASVMLFGVTAVAALDRQTVVEIETV